MILPSALCQLLWKKAIDLLFSFLDRHRPCRSHNSLIAYDPDDDDDDLDDDDLDDDDCLSSFFASLAPVSSR